MKTEEKMVSFSTASGQDVLNFVGEVNKHLNTGWKVKPATIHDIASNAVRRTCVVLYREVQEDKNED